MRYLSEYTAHTIESSRWYGDFNRSTFGLGAKNGSRNGFTHHHLQYLTGEHDASHPHKSHLPHCPPLATPGPVLEALLPDDTEKVPVNYKSTGHEGTKFLLDITLRVALSGFLLISALHWLLCFLFPFPHGPGLPFCLPLKWLAFEPP